MYEHGMWGIATIIGPVILLAVLVWAIVRNRKSRASEDLTERATRANYQAEDEAAKNGDF
jgi:hypothetical protein